MVIVSSVGRVTKNTKLLYHAPTPYRIGIYVLHMSRSPICVSLPSTRFEEHQTKQKRRKWILVHQILMRLQRRWRVAQGCIDVCIPQADSQFPKWFVPLTELENAVHLKNSWDSHIIAVRQKSLTSYRAVLHIIPYRNHRSTWNTPGEHHFVSDSTVLRVYLLTNKYLWIMQDVRF